MSKGFLDTAESIAGILPGAIRGVRSVLGNFKQTSHREAAFATPASFAMVQNNVTLMGKQSPVTHPTLGMSGVRHTFSQPLGTIAPSYGGSTPVPLGFWRTSDGPAIVGPDNFSILLTPYILQGPLAFEAASHEKYVFREIRIKLITYQTTTFKGVGCLCIENDPAQFVSSDFNTARMVTPSVTFPYRIPEAVLEYVFEGPELFYVTPPTGADVAQQRQNHQAILRGFDANGGNGINDICMYAEISGSIELYNPIPPLAGVATNLRERLAVEAVLKAMRPAHVVPTVLGQSVRDQQWLQSLSSAAAAVPDDLQCEKREIEDDDEVSWGPPPEETPAAAAVSPSRPSATRDRLRNSP